MAEARLAFVAFFKDAGDALAGVALVTDERGYPLEFRVSAPVSPSRLERALYARWLRSYLVTAAIGPPLLASVKTPFEIMIADCPEALALSCPAPLACVGPEGRGPLGDGPFEARMLEMGGKSVMAEARAGAFPILQQAAGRVNPLDVFQRMDAAYGALGERNAG